MKRSRKKLVPWALMLLACSVMAAATDSSFEVEETQRKKLALKELFSNSRDDRQLPVIYNRESSLFKQYMKTRFPRKVKEDRQLVPAEKVVRTSVTVRENTSANVVGTNQNGDHVVKLDVADPQKQPQDSAENVPVKRRKVKKSKKLVKRKRQSKPTTIISSTSAKTFGANPVELEQQARIKDLMKFVYKVDDVLYRRPSIDSALDDSGSIVANDVFVAPVTSGPPFKTSGPVFTSEPDFSPITASPTLGKFVEPNSNPLPPGVIYYKPIVPDAVTFPTGPKGVSSKPSVLRPPPPPPPTRRPGKQILAATTPHPLVFGFKPIVRFPEVPPPLPPPPPPPGRGRPVPIHGAFRSVGSILKPIRFPSKL